MAAEDEGRTEEPTGRRLQESREKGMVPKSTDLAAALGLLSGVGGVWWFSSGLSDAIRRATIECIRAIPRHDRIPGELFLLSWQGYLFCLKLLGPLLGLVLAAGIGAGLLQVGFLWTLEPLMPDFSKLFKLGNLKRIISGSSLVELGKTLVKMSIVAVVGYLAVAAHFGEYLILFDQPPARIASLLFSVSVEVTVKCAAALLALGAFDFWWQRRRHREGLKMTKQEVKDEARNTEGDPHIKGKIRKLRREMHKRFMLRELPKATVVVTNPTFIAIALRYEQGRDEAPVVLAKGKRLIAERIRDEASRLGIPVVEDKPLARGLYDAVEPGERIPPEFFAAVAEILAYVYGLKRPSRA